MKWIFKGICVGLVMIAFAFGLGWVTMQLWNWVVPGLITGAHAIDYWHAIGLLVLCKILFGGFRKGGGCYGGRCGRGRWKHHRHGPWRKRWEEKMANMTPEQKEKFMKGMGDCGWGGNCEDDVKKEEAK